MTHARTMFTSIPFRVLPITALMMMSLGAVAADRNNPIPKNAKIISLFEEDKQDKNRLSLMTKDLHVIYEKNTEDKEKAMLYFNSKAKGKTYTIEAETVELENENPNLAVLLASKADNLTVNFGTEKKPLSSLTITSVPRVSDPVKGLPPAMMTIENSSNATLNLFADKINLSIVGKAEKGPVTRNVLGFYALANSPVKNNKINVEAKDEIVINGNVGNGYAQDHLVPTYPAEGNTININQKSSNNPNVKITGNIATQNSDKIGHKNRINLRLTTKDSFIEGAIFDFSDNDRTHIASEGTHLELSNGAVWKLKGALTRSEDPTKPVVHQLSHLELNKDSSVIFDHEENKFRDVVITNDLTAKDGQGGTFILNVDATQNKHADRIQVEGTHTGTHYLKLENKGTGIDGADQTILVFVKDEQGEFKAKDSDKGIFFEKYKLEKGPLNKDKYTPWYLKKIIPTHDDTPVVVDVNRQMGDRYLFLRTGDSYRQRVGMGEVRKETHGVWSRARRLGDFNKVESGYLHNWVRDNAVQTVSATVDYGKNKTFKDYGVNLYFTRHMDNGFYWDTALGFHHLKSHIKAMDRDKKTYTAQASHTRTNVSTEVGYGIDLGNRFMLEPSAQVRVMRVAETDYTLTNGLKVHEGAYVSVVSRVGLNLSKSFESGFAVYVKGDVLREFGGKQTVKLTMPKESDTRKVHRKDTWFEYGLGVSFTKKRWQVYGDIATQSHQKGKRKPTANVGVRYFF